MPTPLETHLDELITELKQRNATVQEKKKSWTGWVVALGVALLSLIGIGVVLWLSRKHAQELAAAKTELEQAKVLVKQKEYQRDQAQLQADRDTLSTEIVHLKEEIDERSALLNLRYAEDEARQKELKGLKTWGEINKS